jgi:hypothetical protein
VAEIVSFDHVPARRTGSSGRQFCAWFFVFTT